MSGRRRAMLKRRAPSSAGKKRTKRPKLVPCAVSSKILKEALLQQKEIQREEDNVAHEILSTRIPCLKEDDVDDEGDSDDFEGFSETQSQYAQSNFESEKLLEAFDDDLADIIVGKIKDAQLSIGVKPLLNLDNSIIDIIEHYKGVGQLLNKYTSGKMPEPFKRIPSLQFWEEVLYLTEPDKWSSNAMYEATRIFVSNMGVKKAERFLKIVLLPRVREDIRKNQILHPALYRSLKKALYKPAAFNKGIIFPLCESGTCTLREAAIVGSIIEKVSIPCLHSSVALLKLVEMEYYDTTSYFIKVLIEKKYALPYRVLDALVAHFMKFYDDSRVMHVIWHQTLLAFAERYKNELTKEDKANLNTLVERQRHALITPEILRELNNSRNRGEKDDDSMPIYILSSSPL
ncbi:bystin-like protein [Perilla frutescens var. hirtella]|uniref:Bystin-like protein n=1 Tax=Perilla frutescens var. hirtella TaxID=608512 RepID=A0AAD4J504_PERFH|nr:bystin-like protein [Perilla frutescens var. hirtella]